MRIKYRSGLFHIQTNPAMTTLPVPADRITEFDALPVEAVNEAYLNPQKWIPFELVKPWQETLEVPPIGPHLVIDEEVLYGEPDMDLSAFRAAVGAAIPRAEVECSRLNLVFEESR